RVAAEREAGREMSEAELSAFWTKKAVNFIISNPGKFASLVWKKSVYLVSGFENSDNTDIYYQRTKSRLFSLLLWNLDDWLYFPFGLLLPLALLGIYVHRDRGRDLAPLYLFVLAYIPTIVLFLVTARHRLPLVPFLIILAAAGVVKLVHARRSRSGREWIVIGLVFLVSLFVLNRTYYDLSSDNMFQIHFNNGLQYERIGDYVSAEKEYLLADQNHPFSATLINNLAYTQFRQGKHSEADRNYHRGLKIDPDYAPLYNNLGLVVAEQEQYDSALYLLHTALNKYDTTITPPNNIGQVWLNIADVQEGRGELDSAAAAYQTAMMIAPEYAKLYKQGAAFFARYGGHHITDSLYKLVRHFEDLTATDYFNWGLSYMQRKRYTDGVSKMMMALKENQNMHQAWYCIGLVYYETGEPRDSVYQFLDRCLEIDSSFQQALDLKALLEERGY
ncbi:MAG: tetratricopeptide repeat protein, partial [candidate division Zixibacteria bacterium]|nr:tetratricopeptide repeat protein [candidate division Zixibacteria bacterium]